MGAATPGVKEPVAIDGPNWKQVQAQLRGVHIRFLECLGCAGLPLLLAYQTGRSLRDTVTGPARVRADERKNATPGTAVQMAHTTQALMGALGRTRIGILQEWFATLAAHFPENTAAVVKASLGRWSDWMSTAFDETTPGKLKANQNKDKLADETAQTLLRQGDVWLNLLVGAKTLDDMLTPESSVAAGEEALSRSARIIRRIALHYWAALLIVILAGAGLTAVAATYLGGAGRVWTQIVTIAGTLGITAKGISSRVSRLADAGEKPIYRAAAVDALAWSVTALPDVKLDTRGVRRLRRSGIQKSAPLGRP